MITQRRTIDLFAMVLAICLGLFGPAPAAAQTTERVSVSSSGEKGEFGGHLSQISADGRFVVFQSGSRNLVPNDTNSSFDFDLFRDIFVRDRSTGTTERANLVDGSLDQAELNSNSFDPSISADGRFVLFRSNATNLVPEPISGFFDIFLRDRLNMTTELISGGDGGSVANGQSVDASVTPDGRFVIFGSNASNLVPGDTNGVTDVFLRDRNLGTTVRVSLDSSGGQIDVGSSFSGAVTPDGQFVVFSSTAADIVPGDTNGFQDVFVRDLVSGMNERVSIGTGGIEGNGGAGASARASISADGRFVVFQSCASNLVAGDTNVECDIFVHDRLAGTTERVSVSSTGDQGDNRSSAAGISPDGRFVVFASSASDLVPGDTNRIIVSPFSGVDAFVHDRLTGTTERANLTSDGLQIDRFPLPFMRATMSKDGRFVAFDSAGEDVVLEPTTPFTTDAYVRDRLSTGTDAGMDAVVQPPAVDDTGADAGAPVTLTFDEVTVAGDTTVTVTDSGPAPPTGFALGDPAVYFDINTTAAFTGNVEVCISYAGLSFTVPEADLQLYHDDGGGGGLADVTSFLDTSIDVICGVVTSLSPFAILQPSSGEPEPDPLALLTELRDGIVVLNLQQGIANSLDKKLAAVEMSISDVNMNNEAAAVGALEALINELLAQSGKEIPAADADALIALADTTIELLAGP